MARGLARRLGKPHRTILEQAIGAEFLRLSRDQEALDRHIALYASLIGRRP